jgi:hypothetical protein
LGNGVKQGGCMAERKKTDVAAAGQAVIVPSAWSVESWFEGRYAGREAFRQLLRDGLVAAFQASAPELILSDPDFSDWPLGEHVVVQGLNDWALAGSSRKLTMLAANYDEVVRRHALFVAWRVRWAHKIECRRWRQGDPLELPSLLWTPRWAMQRDDIDRCTGLASCAPRWRVAMREQIEQWLRRSVAGFPASTLGV